MSEFIKMKLSEARAKFENLDELSQDTVRTYYNKAGEQGKKIADKMKMGGGDWSNDGSDTKTLKKRSAGRTMALKRRIGEVKMSEDVEDLDEISKATMGRYINKAKDSIDTASYRQGHKEAHGSSSKTLEKKLTKRHKGISTAVNKLTKEEAEELDELSKGTLNSYVVKSLVPSSEKSISNLASKGGFEHGERGDEDPSAGEKDDAKSRKRSLGVLTAVRKLAKEEAEELEELKGDQHKIDANKNGKVDAHDFKLLRAKKKVAEETDGCMTDTSSGGADQIAQSKVGEIYKKPSKSRDAMNATAINKRVPAVESAILDVMAKTFEKRKMFEDASNISIISPAQRQDWLNVSTGNMEVVDYFNKYKV